MNPDLRDTPYAGPSGRENFSCIILNPGDKVIPKHGWAIDYNEAYQAAEKAGDTELCAHLYGLSKLFWRADMMPHRLFDILELHYPKGDFLPFLPQLGHAICFARRDDGANVRTFEAKLLALEEMVDQRSMEIAADKTKGPYTVARLRDQIRVSDQTLNKYAKLADVPTPKVGEKNHTYTVDEVRKILKTIIEKTTYARLIKCCREVLDELQNQK